MEPGTPSTKAKTWAAEVIAPGGVYYIESGIIISATAAAEELNILLKRARTAVTGF